MAKGTLQIAYDKLLLENLELKERITELEDVYLGQLRVIARSRITYKERVERMAALAEQALEAENSNEQ